MSDGPFFTCPRRIEDGRDREDAPFPRSGPYQDLWEVRHYPDSPGIINNGVRSCTYCGSMHPDDFMAHVEAGTGEVGPTDKSYKAYLTYIPPRKSNGKFYYQHLSLEQRSRFIELVNSKSMLIGYPGYFYVLPYFTRVAT